MHPLGGVWKTIVKPLERSVRFAVRSPHYAIIALLIDLQMIASKKECSIIKNKNNNSIGVDVSKARLDIVLPPILSPGII
jgi:hypothetical protein